VGRTLEALRVPGFGRLAASYTVNEAGDWLGSVALAILVFAHTHSAVATTALFIAAKFVPAFAAPALTARLDQLQPRAVLPALYVGEAAAFAVLAYVVRHFALGAVLVLALVDGALALTGRAITRASVAAVLEPVGRLRDGNALLNIGFAVAAAAGPAIAGVVVAGLGLRTALLLDAGSFLAIALVMAGARAIPHGRAERDSWAERVRGGLRYVRERRVLRGLLAAEALALVFFAAIVPIEIVYAMRSLHTGSAGYGGLLAAWGVGIVLGSVLFTAGAWRSSVAPIFLSTAAVGVAYLGMAAAGSLALACAWSVLGGVGNGVQWVSVVTTLQQVTRPEYQARVVGLLESIGAAMPGAGFVLGGAITRVLSPRATFAVAGGGVLAIVAVALARVRSPGSLAAALSGEVAAAEGSAGPAK
jgi:predicted MFS family arabinose efflux permease